MTDEEQALAKAYETYRDDGHSFWRVRNACRAYHQAMIVATPGVCFHDPDGTVRQTTWKDLWCTEPDDSAMSAMIHLRADMLNLAGIVDSLADLASITQVRWNAPKIAGRMRSAINKPEYVAASTRPLTVKAEVAS